MCSKLFIFGFYDVMRFLADRTNGRTYATVVPMLQ